MNIDEMTIGDFKELSSIFKGSEKIESLNCQVGEKVIIRTYSAGNWFGLLEQKAGNEVVLKDARRMWRWKTAGGVSLSGIAEHGIELENSKIETPVSHVWLEAIEILSLSKKSIKSLEGAKNVEAE